MLKSLDNYKEVGFLLFRIAFGLMFIAHGFPKLMGGPEVWEKIGRTMGMVGIDFGFMFWGFMAAVSETFGGLFFMLGLFFRPACIFLAITMFVAFFMHYYKGDDFMVYSHALESLIVFVSFTFIGPGKMTVQK